MFSNKSGKLAEIKLPKRKCNISSLKRLKEAIHRQCPFRGREESIPYCRVENQAIIYPHVLKRLNGKQDMVKASKLAITISQ